MPSEESFQRFQKKFHELTGPERREDLVDKIDELLHGRTQTSIRPDAAKMHSRKTILLK